MPADFPAHASPGLPPLASPRPSNSRNFSDFDLRKHGRDTADPDSPSAAEELPGSTPPPLVSPKLSPPTTPNGTAVLSAPTTDLTDPSSSASETTAPPPALLEKLPGVTCEVRARIPTTAGQEMFLHLYHNSADNKEHLAIVFGPHIRSRSLDAPRPGETEKDRMIRGAYVGTLYPGRTSSRIEQIRREAGLAPKPPSPLHSSVSAQEPDSAAAAAAAAESDAHDHHHQDHEAPPTTAPLVRIHSECYTGETVWSARCDCGEQLDEAARLMSLDPSGGVIIYLRQEGRGIGLLSKLKAYNLQDLGHDTMQANLLLRHPADARSYGLATAMLMDLDLGGARGIRLLTNNPEKVRAVEGPGREVVVKERVAMIPLAWSSGGEKGVHGPEVEKYISTKIEKFKHMFSS